MCVILGCKSEKPSLEILEKCHSDNPDGAGIAWFEDFKSENGETKTIAKYEKGLNVRELFQLVEKLPLPFCIHFRASSMGGKSSFLTHPFEVTEDSLLRLKGEGNQLLMHNGHFNDWKICLAAKGLSFPANDTFSDSRAIACIISKGNERFLQEIRGKFILIDATKKKFFLYGETFIEENGIYYSNMGWRSGRTRYRASVIPTSVSANVSHSDWKSIEAKVDEAVKEKKVKLLTAGQTNETKEKKTDTSPPVSPEQLQTLLEKFSCPQELSKSQKKKLFKKWCRTHGIAFVSWREVYNKIVVGNSADNGKNELNFGC